MGLIQRINYIIAANLNDLVDRFEDPEKILKQAIRDMEESLSEATAATARAIAGEKLLGKELEEHERAARQWARRAEDAVRGGEEELARRALERKNEHEKLARALADQLQVANQATRKLRVRIAAMRAKCAQAKRKLATLIARQKAAQARRMIGQIASGTACHSSAFARFDQMRERVELAEAESDAWFELEGLPDDTLEADLESDEDRHKIESELASLKEKLARQAPAPGDAAAGGST